MLISDNDCQMDPKPGRPLTMADRMAHKIMQQVQMVACVLRSLERVSTESPGEEAQLLAAQEDALNYLAFIRDRYGGVLRSFSKPEE